MIWSRVGKLFSKLKAGLIYCIPYDLLSSFFYLGYLPEWNATVSCMVAVAIMFATSVFFGGLFPHFGSWGTYVGPMACWAMILSIYTFICVMLFGPMFAKRSRSLDPMTIDAVAILFMVYALAMPAIFKILSTIVPSVSHFLARFAYVPGSVVEILCGICLAIAPLALFRFIDEMEPWPVSFLRIKYTHSIACKTLSTLISGIYSALAFYFLAFIPFGLSFTEAYAQLASVLRATFAHFHGLLWGILGLFRWYKVYALARFLGIIKILDGLGLVDMNVLDYKYRYLT